VGVLVTGTVNNPGIKLFSNPAHWSQADILSFIVFGQPASAASSPNLQLLMRAAQALNTRGGKSGISSLQQNLQKNLGFNELQFVSGVNENFGNQQQTNSLVIGKTLSPRLTISYSLNIFNAFNTLRLRYLLKKNWFLQTNSSVIGNGADIIYSIKK
jgi:translocation and assembly module TamB